jgi:hypothetical protein
VYGWRRVLSLDGCGGNDGKKPTSSSSSSLSGEMEMDEELPLTVYETISSLSSTSPGGGRVTKQTSVRIGRTSREASERELHSLAHYMRRMLACGRIFIIDYNILITKLRIV